MQTILFIITLNIKMKKFLFFFNAIVLLFGLLLPSTAVAQEKNRKAGETDTYRRSSLCLMLITHQGENYAKAIEEQFQAMPLPSRYNSLNVDVRVISTKKKVTDSRVEEWLKDRGVAKELVAKWFNRGYDGQMNMDRIHKWGGYNASFADLKRAQSTERGVALLSDEGTELLKNTFVMVCDISYYDRANTGNWLSAIMAVGAAYLDVSAQQQAKKGNSSTASTYSGLANLASAGSEAAQDIAGFSVNVMARLYRLKWDDKMRDELYSQYWIDETTPAGEVQRRKAAFDNDRKSYKLEYLGRYRSRSGKTVSKSKNDLDLVIREVCAEAVDRSINNLSKMFPVFKPKTPFYCEGSNIYAYIGTKEGVTSKSKFEVLETKKNKSGISYDKVGEVKTAQVWNNTGIYMTQENLEQQYKGSRFSRSSGRKDICDQGLLLREKGKLGYQYKRNAFWLNLSAGKITTSKKNALKAMEKTEKSLKEKNNIVVDKFDPMIFGVDIGWIINYHTNFAWNPINADFRFGSEYWEAGATTGLILRTNPLGKRGRFALFVWPSAGYRFTAATMKYTTYWSGTEYKSSTKKYSYYFNKDEQTLKNVSFNSFDWNIKAGITLSEKMSLSYGYNDLEQTVNLSFYF